MTRSESFNLKTDEIKEAITDYLNKKKGDEVYFREDIEGFQVNQSSEDIREYSLYIGFKSEVL